MAEVVQKRVLPTHKRKSVWRRIRENIWAYVLIAPMLILTLVFSIYPLIGSIRYAFYNWQGFGEPTEFVGIRHFVDVATDKWFWSAFLNTAIYTAVLVPIQLTLALVMALVLNNPKLRFSSFYRALFFLPVVTSLAVIGVVMQLLFGRLSANFPQWMIDAGWVKPYLGILNDPHLALPAVILVGIWVGFGINMVFFLAALQSVPIDLYEAATVDGAGKWAKFRYITVPVIRPIGTIIVFLAVLGSMRVFDLVLTMTNGGPYKATEVLSTYIYGYVFGGGGRQTQTTSNYGYASAASFFVGILLLGLSIGQVIAFRQAQRKRREYGLDAQSSNAN